MEKNEKNYYTIDLLHIVKVLWHRAWIIVLAAILVAGAGFVYSRFFIKPTYSSSILLYVNNNNSGDKINISSSDLNAAQSLVKTYGEILNNRTTLNEVIEEANVDYTYEDLSKMIKSAPANDTEIMRVTVTTTDPEESANIANAITKVLPERIAGVIEGTSMNVVEYAIPDYQKVAPSVSKHTVIGGLIGFVISIGVIAIIAMLDDTIHDEDYVVQSYKYPILAKVPNLVYSSAKPYSYYSKGSSDIDN